MSQSVRVPVREHVHTREHDLCLFGPAPLMLPAASGPGRALSIAE